MAMLSNIPAHKKCLFQVQQIMCRKKERDRDQIQAYKVIEITPPPRNLGVRCLSPKQHCTSLFFPSSHWNFNAIFTCSFTILLLLCFSISIIRLFVIKQQSILIFIHK